MSSTILVFNQLKRHRHTLCGNLGLLMFASNASISIVSKNIPIFLLLTGGFIVASVVSMGKVTVQREWKNVVQVPWIAWSGAFVGVCAIAFLYTVPFRYAPAVPVDLVMYTGPGMVVLFTCLVLPGQRLTLTTLLAITVGFIGVSLPLLAQVRDQTFEWAHLIGYLLAILHVVVSSSYLMFTKLYGKRHFDMPGIVTVFGIPLAYGLHVMLEQPMMLSLRDYGVILYFGLVNTYLANCFWFHGVAHGNLKFLNASAFFNPIISVGLLIVLGQATLTPTVAIACLLVTVSTSLQDKKDNIKEKLKEHRKVKQVSAKLKMKEA